MKQIRQLTSWLYQNRHPVVMLSALLLLSTGVAFILLPTLWEEVQSWGVLLNMPNSVEIKALETEVAALKQEGNAIQEQLDAAIATHEFRYSDQRTLGFLNRMADSLGLEIKSIDSDRSQEHRRQKLWHITLRAEGRYHQFGFFASRLESPEHKMLIRQLNLMRITPQNTRLSGTIVVSAGGTNLWQE